MKKIGLLCLVLVLTLGAIGIGLARWSDTVTIEGSVASGKVCLDFVPNSFMAKDGVTPPPPYVGANPADIDWTCDMDNGMANVHKLDKNVGWTIGELEDTDSDGTLDTLKVTINNAYPGYEAYADFTVGNVGDYDVQIKSVTIDNPNSEALSMSVTDCYLSLLSQMEMMNGKKLYCWRLWPALWCPLQQWQMISLKDSQMLSSISSRPLVEVVPS